MNAKKTMAMALLLLPLQGIQAADAPKEADLRAATEAKLEAAQQRLDAAAREVADLSMSLSDTIMPRDMLFMGMRQRSQLGIVISPPDADERRDGVEILSVSPGGAAATAGLQAGDVITEVNGKSLQRKGEESSRSQLLAMLSDVKPGEKVTVSYRRGDKTASASVVTQAPVRRAFNLPPLPPPPFAGGPGLPYMMFPGSDGVFGSAELAPLTPKLGQYFGTDKGLLVVRGPGDDRLKLEDGDVIVDIDGRVPDNAAHAARILGSYESGEKLKLNVLRMKKRVTLEVEVPADSPERKFRRHLERARMSPDDAVSMPGLPGPGMMPPLPAPRGIALRAQDTTL